MSASKLDMESIVNKTTQVRVAVVWNDSVFSETLLDPSKGVVLGTNNKADVRAPTHALLATDAYQLFQPSTVGAQLSLPNNTTGWVEQGGQRKSFSNEPGMHALKEGDRGLINVNEQLAVFFYVTSSSQHKFVTPILAALESRFFSSLLFAMILHFGLLITAFATKDYEAFVNVQIDDRFTEVLTQKNEEVEVDLEDEEEEEEDVGKQAGGEEGKFGEEDKLDKSKVPTTDGELVDKIKNVGLAKALSSSLMGRGALSSVFGNKNGFSDQLNAAMSGGDGELVMGHGAGGMGLRGTGSGGGGSGFGRIHGMGKIDTGGGRGTRARLGGRGKAKKKFKVRRGRPSVGNFCKMSDILRVVNSRQRGIQYCYEKELARNPELGGKVTLVWRIGLDGKVLGKATIAKSTLKNGVVESCMTRSVSRWKFTKPDGGICEIKFPFVFNSGF